MIRNKGVFKQYSFLMLFFAFSIRIAFAQVNTLPIAINNYATADQDTTLSVPSGAPDNYTNLLDNASDVDGDTLQVTRFSIDGGITWINAGGTFNIAGIGSITINADGTYTFTPTPGYSGIVPDIIYEVSDGTDMVTAILYLTVETSGDLIEMGDIISCNQGYTADGYYKIRYHITIKNKSITRGDHQNSEISTIQLFDDLEAVFGDTCIFEIERGGLSSSQVDKTYNSSDGIYPIDFSIVSWDAVSFDVSHATPGAQGLFNAGSVSTAKLYPRQSVNLEFCVYVDPLCDGRDGTSVDFENILNVTSSRGVDSSSLIITDFHTSETTVAAKFFIPDLDGNIYDPEIQPDATFEYNHRIIITNDGVATANNVNFNLGLKSFMDKGVIFNTIDITQVSGPTVNINPLFDGINETLMLTNGNSLAAGETVILNINYVIAPLPAVSDVMYFRQLATSMTQGVADQQGKPSNLSNVDEFNTIYTQYFAYVIWSDTQGNHLDRYYKAETNVDIPSSNDQCQCETLGMRLPYTLTAYLYKESTVINNNPAGIEEFEEVSFELTLTNTSDILNLENLQITDDLNLICGGNIVSVSTPTIISSTADVDPIINQSFDGITDLNIFNGTSGVLKVVDNSVSPAIPAQFVTVQFNVIFKDDCIGVNNATFSATDHSGVNSITGVNSPVDLNNNPVDSSVDVSSDSDNDGITNINDIDDDNDGIIDTEEYNGLDPLLDHNNDNIPNYRDPDFGVDVNNDGIIDVFDFDLDGIPNHFDLDSDNDGITDIVEAGGVDLDNNGLVPVNADGTLILDLDNDGLTDDVLVDTNGDGAADTPVDIDVGGGVLIPNLDSDNDAHVNALDIDSDNDGIVDNIEAQISDAYVSPNTPDLLGLVYSNGLQTADTDGDGIPDYLDSNSDNDSRLDIVEGWDTDNDGIAETIALNSDADNDGLDDAFDINSLSVNPVTNATNTQTPINFPNRDNPFTSELDWREIPALVVLISNESAIEGNDLNFTISLVSLGSYIDNTLVPKASAFDIKIELFTGEDDTVSQYEKAKENFDYSPIIQSNTEITIPGDGITTSFIFTIHNGVNVIQTFDDTIDELNEFFVLNGLVITENTINPDTNQVENNVPCKGIGTIIDNDNAPDLIMNDDIKDEGDPLIHIVKIDSSINPTTASSRPIDIKIVVTDQTAIHPEDYINTSPDTITIPATDDPNNPNTYVEYSITTILDAINEPDNETISVVGTVIAGVVGNIDLIKTGTIIDKQPPPKVIISNPTVVEGGILDFTISLVHPATNEPLAHYEDINLNIFTNNGTAREPDDYTAISTQIMIPATMLNVKVPVSTNEDKLVEDVEDLILKGVVTTSNTYNIDAEGIGTIIDNDLPNLFLPNNDGFSDVFEIVHLLQYLNFKLQIFDRWGSEVYSYSNNGNPSPEWWDGTINGNPVPEGVYYYTVDYNDGKTKPISGFIQLIR
jgi:gliding motility-associated-like protein